MNRSEFRTVYRNVRKTIATGTSEFIRGVQFYKPGISNEFMHVVRDTSRDHPGEQTCLLVNRMWCSRDYRRNSIAYARECGPVALPR